jgi:SAM-dependent methyltransferase
VKERWYQDRYGDASYPEFWREPRAKALMHAFFGQSFGVILDVGCGEGSITLKLKQACGAREAYGIDISEKATKLALEKGVRAICLDVDNEDFRFEADFFDAVCASEVIEHLFDPDRLIQNCIRVLKPGGIFLLTSPNLACWYNRIALLLGYQPFYTGVSLRHNVGHLREHGLIGNDHLRVATSRALVELVKAHGFHALKAFTVPAGGEPFIVRMISAVFLRLFRYSNMTTFIIAQK